jgi:hypothetical protein
MKERKGTGRGRGGTRRSEPHGRVGHMYTQADPFLLLMHSARLRLFSYALLWKDFLAFMY